MKQCVCIKCTRGKRKCTIRGFLEDLKLARAGKIAPDVAGGEDTTTHGRILAVERKVNKLQQETYETLDDLLGRVERVEHLVENAASSADEYVDGRDEYVAEEVPEGDGSCNEDADSVGWAEFMVELATGGEEGRREDSDAGGGVGDMAEQGTWGEGSPHGVLDANASDGYGPEEGTEREQSPYQDLGFEGWGEN